MPVASTHPDPPGRIRGAAPDLLGIAVFLDSGEEKRMSADAVDPAELPAGRCLGHD